MSQREGWVRCRAPCLFGHLLPSKGQAEADYLGLAIDSHVCTKKKLESHGLLARARAHNFK